MLSFHLGPLAIPVAAALPGGALLAAHGAGWLAGRRRGVSVARHLNDMLLWGALAARLGFIAIWFEAYRAQPWSMLDLRDGGFSLWTGALGALALALWRGWRQAALRLPLTAALLAGALAWASAQAWLAREEAPPLSGQTLRSLSGAPATLPALAQGHPAVVNLWASWCPPCRREMPLLQAAQQNEPGIRFVFANQGEDKAAVSRYLQAEGLRLEHVLLDPGGALGAEYGSVALPTTLFFNAQGRLAATHLGELSAATLASKLAALRDAPHAAKDTR
ncbi:thiol:disulfide interchange protein [Chromobacterium sp. ATCC 53434]|uniref:TlpA disulfide reductase family protein n=1 Tax=Chromobacterium sp. (strain ATCC 53434 / SC 14030) TaxID=2059672 RepID=UPI000C75DBA7|nr:TlpA disulfide reductase family protein [Chromobacterium sp. ATCC 53434]AUH53549.1 thiol:disulfide interchange protein [Chromobacterium sp. ATCC 53434]